MNILRFINPILAGIAKNRVLILFVSLAIIGSSPFFRNIVEAQYEAGATAVTNASISTIAGGGFSSNVPARQAPMVQPTNVTLDPLGRGFYVVDEVNGTSLLRFVNTTANPVTLAGTTIQPKNINLIAGGGDLFDDDISPRDSDLGGVTGLAVASSGGVVYIATPTLTSIRAINVGTTNITAFGKTITPGTITTISTLAFFDFRALALHPVSGELYFISSRVVYKLDDSGTVTPFAGGGTGSEGNGDGGDATAARLTTPMGLVFDKNNNLLIAEGGDPRSTPGSVRKVGANNLISSLAKDLIFPTGITVASNGDAYVALGNAQQIVRVTPAGVKTLVAGTPVLSACNTESNPTCGDGGPATEANLSIPDSTAATTLGLAVDANGVYIPDFRFKRVRFVNLTGTTANLLDTSIAPQRINSVVGSGVPSPYDGGQATGAELFNPNGVTADASGNLFIADTGYNRLRFVNRSASAITLFSSTPSAVTVQAGQIATLNPEAGNSFGDDRIATAFFQSPQGLFATSKGVYITDVLAGTLIKNPPNSLTGKRSGVIRFLNTSNSDVTLFPSNQGATIVVPPGQIKDIAGVRPPDAPQGLGDGQTAKTVAFFPTDVAVDQQGNIFVADQGNNRVRRIDAGTGIVSTVYGDGNTATLNSPTGIAFDASGRLLIADTRNNRIVRQNTAGGQAFSVIADGSKKVGRPRDVVADNSGRIFFTNALSHQIMDLDAPSNSPGTTSVVAGTGSAGYQGDDGPGSLAKLNLPSSREGVNDVQFTANIIALTNGDLLFADTNNNRIRMLKRQNNAIPVTTVSAASFAGAELASESITAAFGDKMATSIQLATSTPLPTSIAGTSVKVRDSAGIERLAPLFFVAPSQINYQVPQGTVNGVAAVTVTSGDGTVSTGTLNISSVAPGIFTANSSGQGVAAAVILRVKGNGAQIYEPISSFDAGQNKFVPIAINMGPDTDQLFLILYGTGIRFRSSLSGVTSTIGGVNADVLYAGPADGFVGLDQSNIRIPRSLVGRGLVDVIMKVDAKTANTINLHVQ